MMTQAELVQEIINRFSLGEMKTVAFNSGIDYESFSHETNNAFAREMVKYAFRRGKMSTLLEELSAANHAFQIVGGEVRLVETEELEQEFAPVERPIDKEREAIIEGLRDYPNLVTICRALTWIMRRL